MRKEEFQLIFVIHPENAFVLETIQNISINNNARIILLKKNTMGPLCSSLLAIDYIANNDELLIIDIYQLPKIDIFPILSSFRTLDGGTIVSPFTYLKLPYAIIDYNTNLICQICKKSTNNINVINFFYFKKSLDFVKSAEKVIEKNIQHNHRFLISFCINELILEDQKIGYFLINEASFYIPKKRGKR